MPRSGGLAHGPANGGSAENVEIVGLIWYPRVPYKPLNLRLFSPQATNAPGSAARGGSLGHPEVEPAPGPGPRLCALMEPELRAVETFKKHWKT